jgi:hypothetical protein
MTKIWIIEEEPPIIKNTNLYWRWLESYIRLKYTTGVTEENIYHLERVCFQLESYGLLNPDN